MTDIVTQLRKCFDEKQGDFRDLLKAADEIERLTTQVRALEAEVSRLERVASNG